MSIQSKLLDVLQAAVSTSPPKDAAAETIRAVIKGQSVCTAEDRKKLQELDRQYGQAYLTVLNSDYPHAKQFFALEQARQVALLAAGQFENADFWGLPDVVSDFQQRQQVAKMQMFQISTAAQVVSKPICAVVARILIEQADQIDQADKEQYSRYAVTFTPSPLSVRLRQLAITVLARVSSGGSSRPAHYAGYLING